MDKDRAVLSTMKLILTILAEVAPIMLLFFAKYCEDRHAKKIGARTPVTETLLRPAGYTLTQEIDEKSSDFIFLSMMATLAAALAAGIFLFLPTKANPVPWFFGSLSIVCTILAWKKVKEIKNSRLGLLGEMAVAEKLQSLQAHGYHSFHALPKDKGGDIDHIVVGPAGVFCIETKTWSKHYSKNTGSQHEASYDGKTIHTHRFNTAQPITQVTENARWLKKELSGALGETVEVQPIVTLPGWYVEASTKNAAVVVLNDKYLPVFIRQRPEKLSEKEIQQISFQLEKRCRDLAY